jgi:cell division transport system permease protein
METFFRLLRRGLADLRLRPLATLLTVCAVAMAAFLGGLFSLFLHNLDAEIGKRHGKVQFQVYWSASADLARVREQWRLLSTLPGLEGMSTFTPEQALEALQDSLGGAMDFSWLKGSSPLPPTALITLAVRDHSEAWSREMYERLKAMPGVDRVTFNPLELDASGSWLAISRSLFWPLAGFCIGIAALVVGYTVRLSMLGNQSEIDVLRLVGARDWYIRLPLASSGAAIGLAGSLCALALLKAVQAYLADILYYPPVWIRIEFIPAWQAASLCLAVTLVSLIASWLAARD